MLKIDKQLNCLLFNASVVTSVIYFFLSLGYWTCATILHYTLKLLGSEVVRVTCNACMLIVDVSSSDNAQVGGL